MGKVKIEIDCVIFNLDNNYLKILIVQETNTTDKISWRLANGCIKKGDTIENTVHKIVKKYTNSENYFITQLKAFDYLKESSIQENITIGYCALVKKQLNVSDNLLNTNIKWVTFNELNILNEKDKAIVDFSLKELRRNSSQTTAAFYLLPEKFTILQAVHLYEEIFGVSIDKSNFRRKIIQRGLLKESEEREENVSHRAAKYYSLNQDYEKYPYYEFSNIYCKENKSINNL